MKQVTALAWKEWRESQAYLWIGLGLFLGLPIIGGLEGVMLFHRRFEIEASGPALVFGSVLAVVTAVGATSRDLRGRLEDFWRSRPVGVLPWMGVKFLVGLAIVLVACELPIGVELMVNRGKEGWPILIWYPFLWGTSYGLGFLAGCAVRQTATAGVAALTAVLLVCCLPVVIPPLQRFGPAMLDEPGGPPSFATGMVVLSAVVVTTTVMVLRRDWRVPSGRKMVYGLIGVALITVTGSAAFQLGTNLPIQQQIDLPGDEWVSSLKMHGGTGTMLTLAHLDNNTSTFPVQSLKRSVTVVDGKLVLGPPARIENEAWGNLINSRSLEIAPGVSVRRDTSRTGGNDSSTEEELVVFDSLSGETLDRLSLWKNPSYVPAAAAAYHAWNNHLYVTGNKRLIVYDLADPKKPRKLSDDPFEPKERPPLDPGDPVLLIDLIDLPGVPADQRMRMSLGDRYGDDGILLIPDQMTGRKPLYVYKGPELLTEKAASFRLIGRYEPSLLDSVDGVTDSSWNQARSDGFLYTTGYGGGDVVNPQTTVFQLNPIKVVGHFAAPGAKLRVLLPDGRAVVAGDHRIYVVGMPKK